MEEVVKKIYKKIIKIQNLKEKVKSKESDLSNLLCSFTKDFIENDFNKVRVDDVLVVLGIDDGIFIAWDIKVIEIENFN